MPDRFRAFVELSTDWFWELNAENVYTYASPGVMAVLGYRPSEVVGKRPRDFSPDYEVDRVIPYLESLEALRRPFADLEHVAIHQDGHSVVLTSTGAPVLGEGGKLLGYRGFHRDISGQSTRLADVVRITNELSRERTIENLYRRAVDLGRRRLGFGRLSIWTVDGPGWIRGTYGTDENGETRYEGLRRLEGDQRTAHLLERRMPYVLVRNTTLRDDQANTVGRGSALSAPIWHGDTVLGVINADNYLDGRPFTSHDGDVLALYASAIGHLIPRIQIEVKLENIRRVVAASGPEPAP